MLGRIHIAFNLLALLPLYYFMLKQGYGYDSILISILLVLLFTNFPDIDIASKRKEILRKVIAWSFYSFFMASALLMKRRVAIKHRGITHSIQGLACFSIIVTLAFLYLGNHFDQVFTSPVVMISPILAYSLHLAGDAITIEGVDFLMNKRKVRGIIRTGKNDPYFIMIYAIAQLLAFYFLIQRNEYDLIPIVSFLITILAIIIPIIIRNI